MATPKYRYFINSIEIFPYNAGDHTFNFEKKSETDVVMTMVLGDDLVCDQLSGAFNFKTQESTDKCAELPFEIQQKCGPDYSTFWEGIISMMEVEYDNDACTVTFKPRKKEYILDDIEVNILDNPNKVFEGGVLGVGVDAFPTPVYYETARYFDETILFVAQKSNPQIVVVIIIFYKINPTGAFYLPGVTNYYDKMAFAPQSDVQQPIPSNYATREMITWKQLMADLHALFDVYWYIDDNYNIHIEHSYFFEGSPGIDLTEARYEKYMRGTDSYSYDMNDYPKKESWKIADHRRSVTLTYGGISNIGKNTNQKTYSTSKIKTDYLSDIGNPREGLFLFATDGGANVISPGAWFMILGERNYRLEPDHLARTVQSFRRPDLYAILRGQQSFSNGYSQSFAGGVVLSSMKPTKKQKEIEFPLCCDDAFNIQDQIVTAMGNGYPEKFSFNAKTSMAKAILKYAVSNCGTIEPTDIDGLDLWLSQGHGITKDGFGNVSQWDDRSGNGRHAVQANPLNQPNNFTTGSPIQFFSGAIGFTDPQFLVVPGFQLFPGKRGTVIILINQTLLSGSIADVPIISTQGGSGTLWDISLYHDPILNEYRFVSFEDNLNYPSIYSMIGMYILRRPADEVVYGEQNSVISPNNPKNVPNSSPTVNPIIIGPNFNISDPNYTGGSGISMELSEVLIYDRELTDREVEQIQLYFTQKGNYITY